MEQFSTNEGVVAEQLTISEGIASAFKSSMQKVYDFLVNCNTLANSCSIIERLGFDQGSILTCQKNVDNTKKEIEGLLTQVLNCEEEFINLDSDSSNNLDSVFEDDVKEENNNGIISRSSEIIDYSVNEEDLLYRETIDINGKSAKVYSSKNNKALYIVSNDLNDSDKSTLKHSLKNTLQNDQMAVLTYHNDYYKYNINDAKECTNDFAIVGKTDTGKMYSFETIPGRSEINVDDGSNIDTLMTSVNGMVLPNRMRMTMEEGTKLNLQVQVKNNLEGGQTVTEFEKLSFSGGENYSFGSEHATVRLADDWLPYARINNNTNKEVLVVGDGPTGTYGKGQSVIGKVDSAVIPVVVDAHHSGEQSMQGTVCYHHEGKRPGWTSMDMLHFYQKVVPDW